MDKEFKPFDKVLVRDNDEKWRANIFEKLDTGYYRYSCINGYKFSQCIPYEGNEHLLGTTNDYKPPYEPKDGDFVHYEYEIRREYTAIYKSTDDDGKDRSYIEIYDFSREFCTAGGFDVNYKKRRAATEEEKQQLLDALHKDGKDWDEEKKEIVDYKWKPAYCEDYWFVSSLIRPLKCCWSLSIDDERRYSIGNCFKTEEEAIEASNKIKELLNK